MVFAGVGVEGCWFRGEMGFGGYVAWLKGSAMMRGFRVVMWVVEV